MADERGMASSITGSSTIAMPAIAISTSSRSIPSGTTASRAKGNCSSTVTLVNNGEPRDQPSQIVMASSGTAATPKPTLCRMIIRCQPRQ